MLRVTGKNARPFLILDFDTTTRNPKFEILTSSWKAGSVPNTLIDR